MEKAGSQQDLPKKVGVAARAVIIRKTSYLAMVTGYTDEDLAPYQ
jgi:hypothetical protein